MEVAVLITNGDLEIVDEKGCQLIVKLNAQTMKECVLDSISIINGLWLELEWTNGPRISTRAYVSSFHILPSSKLDSAR